MRGPGLAGGLVDRTGADPESDAHRADVRHPLGDDGEAFVEGGVLQAHGRRSTAPVAAG